MLKPPSWEIIESKSIGSSLNIIVEELGEVDRVFLSRAIKIAQDSFKMHIFLKSVKGEKIQDLLLWDSKSGKKSQYDLVLTSSNIIEELGSLGLLYNNYNASLPNFINLNNSTKIFHKKHTLLGDFLTPIAKKCGSFIYDSCQYFSAPEFKSYENLKIVNESEKELFAGLFQKILAEGSLSAKTVNNTLDSSFNLADSLATELTKHTVKLLDVKSENRNIYLMSAFEFAKIHDKRNLKLAYLPTSMCIYDCASIINTSNNIFGCMTFINILLNENFQVYNYQATNGYYLPIVQLNAQRGLHENGLEKSVEKIKQRENNY